jgi:hypothetical protein
MRMVGVLAVLLAVTSAALAQTPAPPAPLAPRPTVTAPEGPSCNTLEKPLSAGGASIVPEIAGQQKNWQPQGGEISFTVRSFVQIPADAFVIVCFRWQRLKPPQLSYITVRPIHLDLIDGGRQLKITVVVPPGLRSPPGRFSGEGEFALLYVVPLADVRILVVAKDKDGNFQIFADVAHAIGVTNPYWAALIALLTVVAMMAILSLVCHTRLKRFGYDDLDPIIRIIATPDGYASLSQLQMVVWTFVVAASAVYVMVLSGELIQITTGTLVLLGISGAVTVAAALHDKSLAQAAVAQATGTPAAPRKPRWSDLVILETSDGHRAIDITRVQMLYFTLITAVFVVMRVVATFVIPEIPDGFQILMGISNAVYMGSKVAQPAPTPSTQAAEPPAAPKT